MNNLPMICGNLDSRRLKLSRRKTMPRTWSRIRSTTNVSFLRIMLPRLIPKVMVCQPRRTLPKSKKIILPQVGTVPPRLRVLVPKFRRILQRFRRILPKLFPRIPSPRSRRILLKFRILPPKSSPSVS
jgi:hypothetical protein